MPDSELEQSLIGDGDDGHHSPPRAVSPTLSNAGRPHLAASIRDRIKTAKDPSRLYLAISRERNLTWWRLAFIAFMLTCSGPFGLEQCVHAGGAQATIMGLFVAPIIYVLPQILLVCELSSMMPSNHGYVLWVYRAFGWGPGFYNGYITMIANFVDVAVKPVLFADYLISQFISADGDTSFGTQYVLRVVCIIVGTGLSLLPPQLMADITGLLSTFIIAPFIVGFFAGVNRIDSKYWNLPPIENDWGLLFSSLLWKYNGWALLGSLAGEVPENDRLAFFNGLTTALGAAVVVYFFPLIVTLTVPGSWHDGYFVRAFDVILPNLGPVISVVGALSALGLFCSGVVVSSRSMWGVAERRWLPSVFTSLSLSTGNPYVVTITHALVVLVFAFFDFSFLVKLLFVLSFFSYVLIFLSFLRLRYTEPNASRPFKVPGGLFFAWVITVLKIIVMSIVLVVNLRTTKVLVAMLVINFVVLSVCFLARNSVNRGGSGRLDFMMDMLVNKRCFPEAEVHEESSQLRMMDDM